MRTIDQAMKQEAKTTNLINFLQAKHPDQIVKKEKGQYAYKGKLSITFFVGEDDVWRYCDHQKRLKGEEGYCGDSIKFLQEIMGGYDFTQAVNALYNFGINS